MQCVIKYAQRARAKSAERKSLHCIWCSINVKRRGKYYHFELVSTDHLRGSLILCRIKRSKERAIEWIVLHTN